MATQADSDSPPAAQTRLIIMGSVALTDGFRLLGFEAWPDPTPEQIESLMSQILEGDTRALVELEQQLADCCACRALERCRVECNRAVVVEIPTLQAPQESHPRIEALLRETLGPAALEDRA
jgi:vacuolar-type H+-ATPase subunit F/Vma7